MNEGQALGDEGADGLCGGGVILALAGGSAALRDGGESFDRKRKEGVDEDEADEADGDPDEAIVEKYTGEVELKGVLLDGSPVAGDSVYEAHADGIEDRGPEMLE